MGILPLRKLMYYVKRGRNWDAPHFKHIEEPPRFPRALNYSITYEIWTIGIYRFTADGGNWEVGQRRKFICDAALYGEPGRFRGLPFRPRKSRYTWTLAGRAGRFSCLVDSVGELTKFRAFATFPRPF